MKVRRECTAATLLVVCLVRTCTSQSLSYALTVRDFLPQQCSKLRTNGQTTASFSTGNSINSLCPYQADLAADRISGHPDFDRSSNALSIPGYFRSEHLISGDDGYILGSSSGGSAAHEKTVEEYLEIAPSGIPKPVYCTGNSLLGFGGMVRCGQYQSGGNFFFATVSEITPKCEYNQGVG